MTLSGRGRFCCFPDPPENQKKVKRGGWGHIPETRGKGVAHQVIKLSPTIQENCSLASLARNFLVRILTIFQKFCQNLSIFVLFPH